MGRARIPSVAVVARRGGGPAYAHLRRRSRIPARPSRAGHVGTGDDRRVLVQPGLERAGIRRRDQREILRTRSARMNSVRRLLLMCAALMLSGCVVYEPVP